MEERKNALHVFYNNEGVWDDSPDFIRDPEHAFSAGKTHWWIVAAESLRQCDDLYVHRPHQIVFRAKIEHELCRRREDGRVEIVFSEQERVNQEFHWNNQNPVRYNALSREPLLIVRRTKLHSSTPKKFRLTDDAMRTAIKETGLAKLKKLDDMKQLLKTLAEMNPTTPDELALFAGQVCEKYRNQ